MRRGLRLQSTLPKTEELSTSKNCGWVGASLAPSSSPRTLPPAVFAEHHTHLKEKEKKERERERRKERVGPGALSYKLWFHSVCMFEISHAFASITR